MTSRTPGVGDSIANKYVVDRVLGEGGMGVVLLATHQQLRQSVAIKVLQPQIAAQAEAAERFRREARAAARIRGEHVCRVLDVGTLDDGVPFMVMEYLEGHDLEEELAQRGRIPVPDAIDYVLQACEGLAEAHAAGIIHRDLKPANLFLSQRSDGSRRIKVLDFGVSKQLLDAATRDRALTLTSSLVGSPLYMSPEQLDSAKDVDRRADVWSLGAVLYELVSGRTAFDGETMPQVVRSILNEQPRPCPGLPPGLHEVIWRALEKQRDQRYASVADFASALSPFAPAHAAGAAARVRRVLSQTPSSDAAVDDHGDPAVAVPRSGRTPLTWDRPSSPESARRRLRVAALAALLVLATVAVIAYLTRGEPEAAAPPHVVAPATAGVAPSAGPSGTKPASAEAEAQHAAEPVLPARESEPVPAPSADVPAAAAPVKPAAVAPEAARPHAAAPTRARKPKSPAAEQPKAVVSGAAEPALQPGLIKDFGGRR